MGYKSPILTVSTVPITISSPPATFDGVAVAVGDRILIKDQVDLTENGIYNYQAGPLTRAQDFNDRDDAVNGVQVLNTNDGIIYAASFTGDYLPGTTSITFSDVNPPSVWGTITGTLADQTDLLAALNLKANLIAPAFTGGVTVEAGINNYFEVQASGGIYGESDQSVYWLAPDIILEANSISFGSTNVSTLLFNEGAYNINGPTLTSGATTRSDLYLRNDLGNAPDGSLSSTQGPTIGLRNADDEWVIQGSKDAEVILYYNGAAAFETTATGFYSYGLSEIDGALTISGNILISTAADWVIRDNTSNQAFKVVDNGATTMYYAGAPKLDTLTDGVLVTGNFQTVGELVIGLNDTTTTQIERINNIGGIQINAGSNLNQGARITLRAGSHATLANDMAFGADNDDDWMFWDDSFGDIQINTGAGASKINTLNLASTGITSQVNLTVGLGSGNPQFLVNAGSTGSPLISLQQAGGNRGTFTYLDSGDILEIDSILSGSSLHLQSNSTTRLTVTALTCTFAQDLAVVGRLNLEAYSEDADSYTVTVGTKTLNTAGATYFYAAAAMTAVALTFAFSNPAATGRVTSIMVEMNNAAGLTGGAPTWPASVDWSGGAEPTWTSGIDVAVFWTRDGGTTWHGNAATLGST